MRPTGAETSVLTRRFNPRVGRDLAVSPNVSGSPRRRRSPGPDQVGRAGSPAGTAEGVGESVALIKRSHQLCSER